MMGWRPRCYVTNFVEIRSLVQAKKIFEGFLPDDIWGWRPFWSCDLYAVSKLLFPLSIARRFHIKSGFDLPNGFRGEAL